MDGIDIRARPPAEVWRARGQVCGTDHVFSIAVLIVMEERSCTHSRVSMATCYPRRDEELGGLVVRGREPQIIDSTELTVHKIAVGSLRVLDAESE